MARLIDADAVRKQIDEKRPGRAYEDAWALTVLDNATTIDAVPVVRCGECKYREEKNFWCERVQDFISNPEWFCADGDRKKGDK